MAAPRADRTTTDDAAEPIRTDTIANALDLQEVGAGANRWTVHVLGFHSDSCHRWIQVAPQPDGTDSLVLKLSMAATVRHALAALDAVAPGPRVGPQVIPVMCMCGRPDRS
jgi:hypothetical protein